MNHSSQAWIPFLVYSPPGLAGAVLMFRKLLGGDLPDRLHASALLVFLLSAGFLAGALVMEGLGLWADALPLTGFHAFTALTVLGSLHYHYLRLEQALNRWRYLRGCLPDAILLVVMAATAGVPEVMALVGAARTLLVVGKVFTHTGIGRRFIDSMIRNPAKLVVLSFAFVILVGTVLLTLPRATEDGRGATVVDALFTSTSATCVTGLVVMNTNRDEEADPALPSFTLFGQVVILVLIQIGGLSIMTLSASAFLLMGGRLSFRSASLMGNVLEENRSNSLPSMIRYIVIMTAAFEATGAILLTVRFALVEPEFSTAAWQGLFHSVSAFCNAGFSLFGRNLERFVSDPVVNLTITSLIVFGGLGFTVIAALVSRETWTHGVRLGWKKLTVHSRLVLIVTLALIAGGTLLLFLCDHAGAQDGLDWSDRLWASYFQSVSARTAGFNTIDLTRTTSAAFLVYVILMFVGASPGGTGGGIKTTTLALLALSIRAVLIGRDDVTVLGRTVPRSTIHRAIAVTFLSGAACLITLLLLLVSQDGITTEQLIFEVTSAFGTVGLSMGATTKLDDFGRVLISLLMFIGRCGPLTLTLALGQRATAAEIGYPDCRVVVG
jgi:trk system potassium uptake protein TrkH